MSSSCVCLVFVTLTHPKICSQICKKRGPLGACLEQVQRTAENDNDLATKYFKDPVVRSRVSDEDVQATDANELIQKLRQQTEDNREKNELSVKTQTAINDQVKYIRVFVYCVFILLYS